MRILSIDARTLTIKLVPEGLDDLWHVSKVLEPGDRLKGSSDRNIKPKAEGQKSIRVKINVTIEVEKVEFHRHSGQLRANGIILEGSPEEFIEVKAHQALEIEPGQAITIHKRSWKEYQIERLKKARDATNKGQLLLVSLDDEGATFAVLKEFEIEPRGVLASGHSGKRFESDEKAEEKFFVEIEKKLAEMRIDRAIIAGPGFVPEKFQKWATNRGLQKKFQIAFEKTADAGLNGVYELVKGDRLTKAAADMQVVRETQLMEKALAELGKRSGKAEYGTERIKMALAMGAVEELLLGEKLLVENPTLAEELTSACEKARGNGKSGRLRPSGRRTLRPA